MTEKELQQISRAIGDAIPKLTDRNLELEIRIGKQIRYKGKDQFRANLTKKLFLKIERQVNSEVNYWDDISVQEFTEYKLPKGVRLRTDSNGEIMESNRKRRVNNTTIKLSNYKEDVRVSLSKESPVDSNGVTESKSKPFTKRRTNYQKEFLLISLTKLSRGNHSSYQIEIEVLNKEALKYPNEYVIKSCIEHIRFLLKNEQYR